MGDGRWEMRGVKKDPSSKKGFEKRGFLLFVWYIMCILCINY